MHEHTSTYILLVSAMVYRPIQFLSTVVIYKVICTTIPYRLLVLQVLRTVAKSNIDVEVLHMLTENLLSICGNMKSIYCRLQQVIQYSTVQYSKIHHKTVRVTPVYPVSNTKETQTMEYIEEA